MNVLVTGGAGFIGRWVVKKLLEENHCVWVVDNLSNGSEENLYEFKDNPFFKGLVCADIADMPDVTSLFKNKFEVCLHLAAQIEVQNSLDNTKKSFNSNLLGTYNLLEACMKQKTTFVFMSTCMVYDTFSSASPEKVGKGITEQHPVKPASPYAATKLAGEQLALSYYYGFGLPVVILRPFNTYGPWQKTNLEGGVVSIFINKFLHGEDLSVFGTGEQTRDLLYVEDCADFIVQAAFSPKAVGQILNAGTGQDITINNLAEIIQPDASKIKHVPHHHPQAEILKLLCDYSLAEKLLGWKPTTSLAEGIKKTEAWIKDQLVKNNTSEKTTSNKFTAFLPYGLHSIDDEDIKTVHEVLTSSWLTTGPKIEAFENALCSAIGCSYAIAVNSGTAALELALQVLDLPEDSEIITTPFTFVATVNSILYNKCKPVFVDISPETLTIDVSKIEEKITTNTKAILFVDFAGYPASIDQLKEIAQKYNLYLIEDAAHALGASYDNFGKRNVGNVADLTIFSFHPVKHITTGEGGAITTNHETWYKKLKILRNHGITKETRERFSKDASWQYDHVALGRNYRITDFQAALGISQLAKLDLFIRKRTELVREYQQLLKGIPEINLPSYPDTVKHAWHLFTILLNTKQYPFLDRDAFFKKIRERNIGVNVHYTPVYHFTYYKEKFYGTELVDHKNYPVTEDVFSRIITLPLFPMMELQDVQRVATCIKEVINELKIEKMSKKKESDIIPQYIYIGKRRIGPGEPCFIIPETTLNHNGSVRQAKNMIDTATALGAECIKFQTFKTESFISDKDLEYSYELADGTKVTEKQYEMFKRYELTEKDFVELKAYAEAKGLIFISTPGGDKESVEILERIGVDAYKIGSDDLTNYPFLAYVAKKGKPIILSTGYSNDEEIKGAVEAIYATGNKQLILLHCVSAYPTTAEIVNLNALKYLRDTYHVPTGFSDHTPGAAVPLTAATLGACVVEKHFTLDRFDKGPDHRFSAEPDELRRILQGVKILHQYPGKLNELLINDDEKRQATVAPGNYRKTFHQSELATKKVAQKSLIYTYDLSAGHILTEDDIDMKRADFKGITNPLKIKELLGKALVRNVTKDELILFEHIS